MVKFLSKAIYSHQDSIINDKHAASYKNLNSLNLIIIYFIDQNYYLAHIINLYSI